MTSNTIRIPLISLIMLLIPSSTTAQQVEIFSQGLDAFNNALQSGIMGLALIQALGMIALVVYSSRNQGQVIQALNTVAASSQITANSADRYADAIEKQTSTIERQGQRQVETIERQTRVMQDEFATSRARQEALSQSIVAIGGVTSDTNTRLVTLSQKMTTLTEDLTTLHGIVDTHVADTSVKDTLERLFKDMDKRMQEIVDAVRELKPTPPPTEPNDELPPAPPRKPLDIDAAKADATVDLPVQADNADSEAA